MRKFVLPIALIASLAVSSVAMAATAPAAAPAPKSTTTIGKVLAVSTKFCTVTVANKGVFIFGAKCNLAKIKVGDKVEITWWLKGALREATKITDDGAAKMMPMMTK
ncbi:MAG TPA: hypothetical protein VHZ56_00755 [Devosia sp.]|jgi:hypothetical protein|nr:hypothetical protein [Devosia sp.]